MPVTYLNQALGYDLKELELKDITIDKKFRFHISFYHLDLSVLEQENKVFFPEFLLSQIETISIDNASYKKLPLGEINIKNQSKKNEKIAHITFNEGSLNTDDKRENKEKIKERKNLFKASLHLSLQPYNHLYLEYLEILLDGVRAQFTGSLLLKEKNHDFFDMLEKLTLQGQINISNNIADQSLKIFYNNFPENAKQATSLFVKKISPTKLDLYQGKIFIGSLLKDQEKISFQGDLSFTFDEPIRLKDYSLYKADLKKLTINRKNNTLLSYFLADFDFQNYQSRDSLFLLQLDQNKAKISSRTGMINNCPVTKIETYLFNKNLSIEVMMDTHTLLEELNTPVSAFAQNKGVAKYEYLSSNKESNSYQEYYQWTNLNLEEKNTNAITIDNISLYNFPEKKEREMKASLSFQEKDFFCQSADLTDHLELQSFTCSYPGEKVHVELFGHKTPFDIRGQLLIKAEAFKTKETKVLDINLDLQSEEFNILSQPDKDSSQHIFAHGNLQKKELNWQSTHENLKLDSTFDNFIKLDKTPYGTLSECFENPWSISTNINIRNLYLFDKSFHNINLSTSPKNITLKGNYLHNEATFSLTEKTGAINFHTLTIDEIKDLYHYLPNNHSSQSFSHLKKLLPEQLTFHSEKTLWKQENFGQLHLRAFISENHLNIKPANLASETISHQGQLCIGKEIETLKGTVEIKKIPKALLEKLEDFGLVEAEGKVLYDLRTSKGFSEIEGSAVIEAKNCKIKRSSNSKTQLFDFLTGRFLENNQINIFDEKTFLIDNIYLKMSRNQFGQIVLSHCLLKIGPLVTVFDGTIEGESIEGNLTILPRVTRVFPAASLMTGQLALSSASLLLDLFLGDEISNFSMQNYPISGTLSKIIINQETVPVVNYQPSTFVQEKEHEDNIPELHYPTAAQLDRQ